MAYYKKFFILLFFCFLFYLFFSNNVFGFEITYNGTTYNLPDLPYDTNTYKNVLFGVLSGNQFAVGMPIDPAKPVNNKFYVSRDEGGASSQTFRYYNAGGQGNFGDWYWYSISMSNLSAWSARKTTSHQFMKFYSNGKLLVSTLDVYSYSSSSGDYTTLYMEANPNEYYIPGISTEYETPKFITTVSELNNFQDLQNLEIDRGDYTNISLRLINSDTNSIIFTTKLSNYDYYLQRLDLDNPFSKLIYRIPINKLPSFSLSNGTNYEFRLIYTNTSGTQVNHSIFFTPTQNQTVNNTTDQDINNGINETNKKIDETNDKIDDVKDSIDNTNDKIDDLNDNITDSDIDNIGANDLPSISVNDPTESGIGSIFTAFYNAFCTGEPQDIVFPIPFTNKNVVLSATYIQDMLSNNGAGWVLLFIQAFWSYLFGRFIIKDISRKISKIKSGNIEDLQSGNIKEEML